MTESGSRSSGAGAPGPLVDGAWLTEHLDDPDLRVIHAGPDREAYDAAHVHGARFLGSADLTEERGGIRALAPGRQAVAALLARVGVSPSHRVVVTGDAGSPWAARAYWTLRYFRFPSVVLADGGIGALEVAGVPVDDEPVDPQPIDFQPEGDGSLGPYEVLDPDPALIATAEQVLELANGERRGVILDCRSDAEYVGQGHGAAEAPRMGRVPRAVHIEWKQLVDDEGRFLPREQLRALYAAAGVNGSTPAYPYCGGGIRSSVAWFVLHELLGYAGAANYDGSWSEWAVREELPIETG